MNPAKRRPVLQVLLPALVAVLVAVPYAGVLGAEFVELDDSTNIVRNLSFRGWSASSFAWMGTTTHMGHYQPLTWFSYSVDYQLGGLNPAVFHGTSVALHAATAVLVYFLARSLFATILPAAPQRTAAFLAAAAFGVHPLRAESVAWVTGRNDILATLFAVVALWAWVGKLRGTGDSAEVEGSSERVVPYGRALLGASFCALLFFSSTQLQGGQLGTRYLGPWGLLLAALAFGWTCRQILKGMVSRKAQQLWLVALAAYGLSLGGKASGIALPGVLLLLDVWLARLGSQPRRPAWGRLVLEKLPFLLLAAAFAVVAAHAKSSSWPIDAAVGQYSVGERLLQMAYGLGFYPWKTLAPTGLLPLYQLPGELRFSDPRFLAGALGLVATLLVLGIAARRTLVPLLTWLAFAVLASPTLGFFQVGDQLVADRYSYLPCIPFALLAGGFAARCSVAGQGARQSVWLTAGVLIALLGAMAAQQANRWRSTESLYAYSAEVGNSPRLLTNFAMLRNAQAAEEPARRGVLLGQALRLSDRAHQAAEAQHMALPYLGLHRGTILYNLGRGEEALRELSSYVDLRPNDPQGRYNLGLTLKRLGRSDEARAYLEPAGRD